MTFEDLLQTAPSQTQELLQQLVADIHTHATPERVNKLQQRLARVKNRIDDTNRRREVLGAQADTIDALLTYLQQQRRDRGDSVELCLLESFLADRQVILRQRLAALKPSDLLQEKHDLTVEISALLRSRNVATALGNTLKEGKRAC